MMPAVEPTAAQLARTQFLMFDGLGDHVALSDEERRRALRLSPQQWSNWSQVKSGGPLPARPDLPVMLRRIGSAAFKLQKLAEKTAG